MFLDISYAAWAAIGAVSQAGITLFLLAVGWRQLVNLRHENRKWYTLEYVNRYDNDPILHECLKSLGQAKRDNTLEEAGASLKPEVATILNYIDGLATGIDQGLYIEAIAKDHLEPIVSVTVKTYLGNDRIVNSLGIQREHYRAAQALVDRWSHRSLSYNEKLRLFGWK